MSLRLKSIALNIFEWLHFSLQPPISSGITARQSFEGSLSVQMKEETMEVLCASTLSTLLLVGCVSAGSAFSVKKGNEAFTVILVAKIPTLFSSKM